MRYNLGYKNSGVDWITYIPEHWEAVRLKDLFHMRSGITFTKSELVEDGYATISYGQVHSKTNVGTRITHDMIRFIPPELVSEGALAKQGDFIFADTSEDLEGCGNCIWVNSSNHIYAGSHTILLKQKTPVKNAYLAYLFQTDAWRRQIRERVSGIKVYSITQSLLSFVSVIFPPSEEQRVIATYLDRETAHIDAIVERLRAQGERYEQLKRSLITETITQGLPNHDPSTFRSLRLKEVCTINPNYSEELADDEEVSFLPMENIKQGYFINDQNRLLSEVKGKYTYCADSDIVMAKITPSFENGNIALLKELANRVGFGSSELITFRPSILANPHFLLYFLQNEKFKNGVAGTIKGVGGLRRIDMDVLKVFIIALPTLEIQSEIVAYLDERCSKIDQLSEKISRKIELLEKLKKSLIEEVVTGLRPVKN